MMRNLLRTLTLSIFNLIFVAIASAESAITTNAPTTAPESATINAVSPETGEPVISVDFKDADIKTVLRVLSMKSKVNIVAGPEVQGVVTIRLEDVPWQKAMEVVLRTYGYVYERDGNIIRVTTRDNLALEPVTTQTYILNYTKAQEVQAAVKDMLTERGRIQVAERTNTIVITDIPTNLYKIGEIVHALDKRTPQAFIDSKVVKTDVGTAENLGIEWQTGGAGNLGRITGSGRPTTFPFPSSTAGDKQNFFFRDFFPRTGVDDNAVQNSEDIRNFPHVPLTTSGGAFTYGTLDFSSFSSILQLLRTRSNTKVVSNPRIVVLNNQIAKIQVGSDIPLPNYERNETTGSVEITGFSYRETGVVLNVVPHINTAEEILVDLRPEISALGATIDFGEFQVPSFTVTKAETQVLIRSGETIAIGGLMTDNVSTNESRVPYLSDVPLLGKAFRSKRQTAGDSNKKVETLFFVTVTMVDTEGQPVAGQTHAVNDPQKKGSVSTPNASVAPAAGSQPVKSGGLANQKSQAHNEPAQSSSEKAATSEAAV